MLNWCRVLITGTDTVAIDTRALTALQRGDVECHDSFPKRFVHAVLASLATPIGDLGDLIELPETLSLLSGALALKPDSETCMQRVALINDALRHMPVLDLSNLEQQALRVIIAFKRIDPCDFVARADNQILEALATKVGITHRYRKIDCDRKDFSLAETIKERMFEAMFNKDPARKNLAVDTLQLCLKFLDEDDLNTPIVESHDGYNALMTAVAARREGGAADKTILEQNTKMIELLLEAGADPDYTPGHPCARYLSAYDLSDHLPQAREILSQTDQDALS